MSYRLLAVVCTLLLVGGIALATDSVSEDGLKQGESIGVFYVTKVAGAEDDGVEPGDDLCYRCRYGSSPMVIVFAQDTGGKVGELVRKLDAAVVQNSEARLKGLLTLFGDEASKLTAKAGEIAEVTGVKTIPVTVAKETKTGPLSYRLSAAAPVTIVVAQDSQVVSMHTFSTESIDIAMVMNEVKQLLH